MSAPLTPDIMRLLDGRNFAHLATLMPDGSPHSAPVWVGVEGHRIIICTDPDSVKSRNTARDPRVAISVTDHDEPYTEAVLRGRVVERRPDSDFKYADAISIKYVGKPWPYRDEQPSLALFIEIDKTQYAKHPFKHTSTVK